MAKEGMRWILCWVFSLYDYYPGCQDSEDRGCRCGLHGLNEPVHLDMPSLVIPHHWHMRGRMRTSV